MPIECDIHVRSASQNEFHQLDKCVMGHAFDIHNSMGRFCDERIYQDELASRCRAAGLDLRREVGIRLTHGSFSKSYFADMLINQSFIYELKAARSLSPSHQNQLINYLLLTDTRHGKLLNLRPTSVQSRFVSTTMTRLDRVNYRLDTTRWEGLEPEHHELRDCLVKIIEDWGTCLDFNVYREALLHFTSGSDGGLQPVPINSGGRIVGFQRMCLLTQDAAWHLSAVKTNFASHERHIHRLLSHTNLRQLHWINLNQNEIQLTTLKNNSVKK